MVSVQATARRAILSSSTRRIGSNVSNQCRSQHQRQLYSSLIASRKSFIPNPSSSRQFLRRPKNDGSNNRSLSSSAPPSSKPPTSASSGSKSGAGNKQKTGSTEIVPNVVLASVLGGFVSFVFLYSMNAVGRGDGVASEGNDPLAQLKAEAQEALEHRDRVEGGGRMTEDEIRALESGIMRDDGEVDGDRIITELAVAAPADIAALEEEANLKIFRKKQDEGEEPKPKKSKWWKFGIF